MWNVLQLTDVAPLWENILSCFIRTCFLISRLFSNPSSCFGMIWVICSAQTWFGKASQTFERSKTLSKMIKSFNTFSRVSFKDDKVCSPLTLSHVCLLNCSCFLEHYQPLAVNELVFCLVTGQEEFRHYASQLSSVKQLWKPICFPTRMRPPSYGSTAVSEVWQFPRVEIQSNFLPWAWLTFFKRRRNQKTRSTIWFFLSSSYFNIFLTHFLI